MTALNLKKISFSFFLSILFTYIISIIILYFTNGNDTNILQIFNPKYQLETWLFVFGWSLGVWGYILMAILFLTIFSLIYRLVSRYI
jgi:hypothetical protein